MFLKTQREKKVEITTEVLLCYFLWQNKHTKNQLCNQPGYAMNTSYRICIQDLTTVFSFRYFWYHEHCFTAIVLSHFSCIQLSATPWTVVLHAPLSTGFSRQEY